jgi:cathepsin F
MHKIVITLALVYLAVADPNDRSSYLAQQFELFIQENNKHYNENEKQERFNIFVSNYEKIQAMTTNAGQNVSYKVAVNKFADMTEDEFKSTYLGLMISPQELAQSSKGGLTYVEETPAIFDWRNTPNVVGPVKDQGKCGSCWAYSAVGNLEGLHGLKTGQFVQYSEQQLIECDNLDLGCVGGTMGRTFQYLMNNGGIELLSDYPDLGKKNEKKCKFDPSKVALSITGFDVYSFLNDENDIKAYLVNTGPLAVALNASALQFYAGGVIDADAASCDPLVLNHAATLVGYGTDENGKDFWEVKNQWGANWGYSGYFRIARGLGTCGINRYVSTAKLA